MAAAQDQSPALVNTVELADLVAHEVNNMLNSVVLHTALLERTLPREVQAAVQGELAVIRQGVNRAGAMLRRWQQFGPKPVVDLEPLDLHRLLRDLPLPEELHNWSGEKVLVRLEAAPKLPRILGNAEDMKRLLGLLLQSAAKASPAGGTVTVRTELDHNQVVLSVEDQGPELETGQLERVFEPFAGVRGDGALNSEDDLWLPARKVLARRQKGAIAADHGAAGGLRIAVRFTVSGDK